MTEDTIKIPKKTAYLVLGFILIFIVGFALGWLVKPSTATGKVIKTAPSTNPSIQNSKQVTFDLKDEPFLGNKDAPVTIVEFTDLQCPFCRRAFVTTFPQLKKEYIENGKVLYVVKDFPLSFHPSALPAAIYANCANEQGKYWEVHDAIFNNQQKQGFGTIQFSENDIKQWISGIDGLDMKKLEACVKSGKYEKEIRQDISEGIAAGVGGTPTFFINGREVVGAQPYSVFKQIIDSELAK